MLPYPLTPEFDLKGKLKRYIDLFVFKTILDKAPLIDDLYSSFARATGRDFVFGPQFIVNTLFSNRRYHHPLYQQVMD